MSGSLIDPPCSTDEMLADINQANMPLRFEVGEQFSFGVIEARPWRHYEEMDPGGKHVLWDGVMQGQSFRQVVTKLWLWMRAYQVRRELSSC